MMKRIVALALCLCFIFGGCAQSTAVPQAEPGGEALLHAAPPLSAPTPTPVPAGDNGPERLALALAALPRLPDEPDENALWERMNGKSPEEQNKLWDEFSERQNAYYEAVRELRGTGVDPALTPAFAQYTLRTARQLVGDGTDENVVWSPANLYLALCMLAETTDGASRAQVLDLLGLESAEQARAAANSLFRSLYRDGGTGKTLLANSLWLNEKFDFKKETVDRLAQEHFASTFRAPMGAETTDDAIREWINENTGHLLEDAANGIETDADTLMLLLSTLYFKGTWAEQFGGRMTAEDTFTAADGTEQKADFMHRSADGDYYRRDGENGGFTVASLPFIGGTAMWFLLPDEGVRVEDLIPGIENLSLCIDATPGSVQDTAYGPVQASRGYAEIRWSVPKFDVNADLDLIPTLEALGVTDVFSGAADFSPLTDVDAYVSAAKHAARVKVDEEGCEAAAFTAILAAPTAALIEPQPVIEMDLDRPFGFLITGADGLPLFAGIVNTLE